MNLQACPRWCQGFWEGSWGGPGLWALQQKPGSEDYQGSQKGFLEGVLEGCFQKVPRPPPRRARPLRNAPFSGRQVKSQKELKTITRLPQTRVTSPWKEAHKGNEDQKWTSGFGFRPLLPGNQQKEGNRYHNKSCFLNCLSCRNPYQTPFLCTDVLRGIPFPKNRHLHQN